MSGGCPRAGRPAAALVACAFIAAFAGGSVPATADSAVGPADPVAAAPADPVAAAEPLPRFVQSLGRLDPPFPAPVRAEVEVRNGTGRAVRIERAVPHCSGCTRITGVPLELAAGGSARVGVVFEPGRSRGALRFGCTLLADGAPWATADAEVLVPGIDLGGSESVDFGSVERGAVTERAFAVRTVAPPGAALECVVRSGSVAAVAAADGPARAEAGGLESTRWLVAVRLACGPGDAPDAAAGELELRLLDRGCVLESRPVTVRAQPWSPATARPAALFLGNVAGMRSVERTVAIPAGPGETSATGAELDAGSPSAGWIQCVLRIPVEPTAPGAWRLLRGSVEIRRGGERWSVPWLGFALGPAGGALPDARALAEVFAFRRDSILASTTAFRERTWIAGELVRPVDPAAPRGDIAIDRLVHRSHDGTVRCTAVRRLLAGGHVDDAVATDGRSEARRSDGGAAEVRACTDHLAHRDPAEWEALGGMVGCASRGTARSPGTDLAAELAGMDAGAVAVSWDRDAVPGVATVRVDLRGGAFDSVWLDPARGLAPVLREASWRDSAIEERNRWSAHGFFGTAGGSEFPAVVRVVQRRRPNRPPASPRTAWSTVFEQTLLCLEHSVDEPAAMPALPADRLLDVARERAERSWSRVPQAIMPAIAAACLGAPACAQGCFGPSSPTLRPADAVAVVRACGGDEGAIDVALSVQSDRLAQWAAQVDAEPEGVPGWWRRVVNARRDAAGDVSPEEAARIRSAARSIREEVMAQRRADREALRSIMAHACGDGPSTAALALSSALLRRPMIFESMEVVTDPLQFLECDAGVVARLESLGAGPALVAAGRSMEEAFAERQQAAIESITEAGTRNSLPMWSEAVAAADAGVRDALERSAAAIGASDPVAGAWLRLRAAGDRILCGRPGGGSVGTEEELEARARVRSALLDLRAVAETLLAQPADPGLSALSGRCASVASALLHAWADPACCPGRAAADLGRRVRECARDVLAAVPDPRGLRTDAEDVYRLASWASAAWWPGSVSSVAGCEEGLPAELLVNTGSDIVGALAATGLPGASVPARAEQCRALRALVDEHAALPMAPSPERAETMGSIHSRARSLADAMVASAAAALPPPEAPGDARRRALLRWALAAFPGLASLHERTVNEVEAVDGVRAASLVAEIDGAIASSLERVLALRAARGPGGDAAGSVTLRMRRELQRAVNAIERAAALSSPPEARDASGIEDLGARLRAIAAGGSGDAPHDH